MVADADLAAVAELMSGHRASILLALLGGEQLTASELAARAGISRSLASAHLSRLLDGGLVAVSQEGRQRHYRLAGAHVADVLEAMARIAPERAAAGAAESRPGSAIREARTCYDHLAGVLGVALTEALVQDRVLRAADGSFRLTAAGQRRLEALGVDVEDLRTRRRSFARGCLDWTERRPHLGGALGAGLADRLLELDWVRRRPGTRAVDVTPLGAQRLHEELRLSVDATVS